MDITQGGIDQTKIERLARKYILLEVGAPFASLRRSFQIAMRGKSWRAFKTTVDPERFEAFSGTRSLPFAAGEHKRIAVKVIDPRGNEVMRVMSLGEQKYKM